MPILKPLAPNGPHASKRRSRMDLTRDMISAPLGDFRHTMHVGRGGDAFGDTSFLSNHGPSKAGEEEETVPNGRGEGFKAEERSLLHVLEDGCEEEEAVHPGDGQTEREGDGGGGGRKSAGSPPRSPPPPPPPGGMKHAESVLSFHVDLGPSMLSDVLGVMEKGPQDGTGPPDAPDQGGCGEGAEAGEEEEEGGSYTFEEEEEEDDEIHV